MTFSRNWAKIHMSQNVPKGFWKCPPIEDCVFVHWNTSLRKDQGTSLCMLTEKCSQYTKCKNKFMKYKFYFCKQLHTKKTKWFFNSTDLKTKKWLTSFGRLLHARYCAKCLHISVTNSQKQFVRLVRIIPALQLGKQKLKESNELAQVSSYCIGSPAFESIPFWLQ